MVCFHLFTHCAQPFSLRTFLRLTYSAPPFAKAFCSTCHPLHVPVYSDIDNACCRVALDAMAQQYPNAKVCPRHSLPLK